MSIKLLNPEPVTRDVWLNIVAIISKRKPVVCLISSLENRSGG